MVFFSLDDMENMMEKNIKENIKENIVIFSLLFSLKINEENKRKRGGRGGEFYRALVHRGFTSNFLFIGGYGFSPSSTLSTATTITPTTFQCRKPTLSGIRVPMDEVRSSNQVHMDEMNSSNPVNVFGPMSLDQV